jgi:hypothetical protein
MIAPINLLFVFVFLLPSRILRKSQTVVTISNPLGVGPTGNDLFWGEVNCLGMLELTTNKGLR